MLNKWRALFAGLLLIGMIGPSFGQDIELRIGDVTIPPSDVSSAACIQVPIFIFDPIDNRDLRDLTFTVEITGSTGIIIGGVTTEMIVANAFVAGDLTGLTNPGTDLVDQDGGNSPSCGLIFNQATQGGDAVNFASGTDNGDWFLNNDDDGRKKCFIVDFGGDPIGFTVGNTEMLVAVLEIPVNANPGPSQLLITATPNADVFGANTYSWDDGVRVDDQGNRAVISANLVLSADAAEVNIVDAVNCTAATATAPITWADTNEVGGVGGSIDFSFPGTENASQVHLVGDGIDVVIPSAGATTTYSIDTVTDLTPDPAGDPSYTATYQVEFPPASGEYVDGTACTLTPAWAAASCSASWSTPPVFGMDTSYSVTLTNAMWDGTKYGQVTGPGGLSFDLIVPTAGAGTNTLTFTDVFTILGIDNSDVGTYTSAGNGPGASNAYSCDLVLTLEPPVLDLGICASMTTGSIEGSIDVTLAGNDGVVDFTVSYNGDVYDNLPAGVFTIPGVSADSTTVSISGNGFDAGGGNISDDVLCDIDFALPTCSASQDPIGTVDVGTVLTLFLDTTNAVAATIAGVPMTANVDANNNFNVQWSSTHIAVADTVLTGTVTNADGETSTCTWTIDINCIDPTIESIAGVGDFGMTIFGTFDCDYTVRVTLHNTGEVTDYTVRIDTLTNAPLSEGIGFLNIEIPADAWIEVGQLGLAGGATDMTPTVPTLGEWGMIALVLSLMGAGVLVMRRRELV